MTLALLLYAAAVLGVGIVAARVSSRGSDAFLLGDRSFGAGAAWAALSSTTIGGSTTLVLAALVARAGLPALWLDLAGALGLAALGLFLARRVRATGAVTISEVIGRLYGPSVRRIAALLVVAAEIVWFALLTEATTAVLTAAAPWEPRRVLVLTTLVFVAYTLLGGQRAVIRTDILQLALMAAGLLGVALPLALRSVARTGVPEALLSFPFGPRLGPMDAAALLLLVGLPHAVGSDVWAKLLSAREETAARRAALGAAVSKLAFGLATVTIALAGIGLGLPGGPGLYPETVVAVAGPGLAPFLLVAMVATMQSSSDSVLLSASAATVHDLLPPRFDRPTPARCFVAIYGALGLAVAVAMPDLIETFRLGYTLFASSLILPTLLAFAPRVRIARGVAGAAMLSGATAAMAERFLHVTGLDPVLVGTGINALFLLAGLRPIRDPSAEPPRRRDRAGGPPPRPPRATP